jgi:hypothetical protein
MAVRLSQAARERESQANEELVALRDKLSLQVGGLFGCCLL